MFAKYIFPQLSAILLTFSCLKAATPDTRSDSFNISHYAITLDLSNLASKTLSGHCELKGISKIDKLDRLSLELYKLNVDSVSQNGKNVSYQYNDSLVTVHLDKLYNTNDSFDVIVYYHGKPVTTTWGGFTFDPSNEYAYNLGIGLYAIPHNFGRVWFPCVDNFIDKATFSFFIKSLNTHKVFCNGLLIDSTLNIDNSLTWHWEMKNPIVPYLASIAIGNYKTLYSSYSGINKKIPIMIGVLPGDTSKAKTTFQHLNQILAEYENYYGPYPFDRVGFVGVNFGGGAMEHATNIALPNSVIEAGLSEESLWAHELSHQWWGDKVTCNSAEEMWLNEGWASFNESMYQHKLYGAKAYNDYARTVHYDALRYGHTVDSIDRPISPMPQEYTYGPTVYKKGADVARTLRAYLGDSLFFTGIHTYMSDLAYQSASSNDFKNELTKGTGVDMTEFFNDWVFSPGWPHFEITTFFKDTETPINNFTTFINLRTINNSLKYNNIPLEITSFDSKWNQTVKTFWTDNSGKYVCQVPLDTSIKFVALDMDGKITDATTKQYMTINKKGTYDYTQSLMNITVDSIRDSALVYIVHNWIGAERTYNTPKNIRLSSDRYWTVDGIIPSGFHATAQVNYDGKTYSSPYSGGFLDNDFLKNVVEDSIVLMFRAYSNVRGTYLMDDWKLLKENTDYTKIMGSHTDEFGTIRITNLKKGQYCFGVYDKRAGINSELPENNDMTLYPNPTTNSLHIKFKEAKIIKLLQVFDTNGKEVKNITNPSPSSFDILIPNLDLAMGTYILEVTTPEGISSKKFVVER